MPPPPSLKKSLHSFRYLLTSDLSSWCFSYLEVLTLYQTTRSKRHHTYAHGPLSARLLLVRCWFFKVVLFAVSRAYIHALAPLQHFLTSIVRSVSFSHRVHWHLFSRKRRNWNGLHVFSQHATHTGFERTATGESSSPGRMPVSTERKAR